MAGLYSSEPLKKGTWLEVKAFNGFAFFGETDVSQWHKYMPMGTPMELNRICTVCGNQPAMPAKSRIDKDTCLECRKYDDWALPCPQNVSFGQGTKGKKSVGHTPQSHQPVYPTAPANVQPSPAAPVKAGGIFDRLPRFMR